MTSKAWLLALVSLAGFGVCAGGFYSGKLPLAKKRPTLARTFDRDEDETEEKGRLGAASRAREPFEERLERLEKIRRAIPGSGGELREGPEFAAEEAFKRRAYPDTVIPASRRSHARSHFWSMRGRGMNFGTRRAGVWQSLGPRRAVYQETDFRLTYVPAEYVASGRITSLAIGPSCSVWSCPLWIAAAGGGVWRAERGLASNPSWDFVSEPLATQAVGSILIDPNDPSGDTVWVGTGESNVSGDSAAGVGLYRTRDAGRHWAGPFGENVFNNRSIGSIAIHPTNRNVIYAATTSGGRGISSTGGATFSIPGAPAWGLYKSTDRGVTWTLIHNGTADVSECTDVALVESGATACSFLGVRRVVLDPVDPHVVYAASYATGVWRSNDAGATWTQIKAVAEPFDFISLPEIVVNTLPNGNTRMYVGDGASGSTASGLSRSDDVRTAAAPVFLQLSNPDPATDGFGSYNYCAGQCWYDNLVYSPPGHPDVVYIGGAYGYGEDLFFSNGRAVALSTDGGQTFTDMTKDDSDPLHPNGLHPDQHAFAVNPNNVFQFFDGSDGGLMRSDGTFADVSSVCAERGLDEPLLSRCQQFLSRVPSSLRSLNKNVSTLQFQSLSVSPFDSRIIQGGTQDNGTFETDGSRDIWLQTFWGDGGQSGFDVGDPDFRFHSYFGPFMDVNFSGGLIEDWNWISDRLVEGSAFYPPLSSDPVNAGWMWAGLEHVWRTKTNAKGNATEDEYRARCNEFTGTFETPCGDWVPVGAASYVEPATYADISLPSPETALTSFGGIYGTDRAGGIVSMVRRGHDPGTLWAATSGGRVFVSKNADAEPFGAVTFARIDTLSSIDPERFVTGIDVDEHNPNHAWIAYSGYSATTPSTPGHVFEVNYNATAGTATWTLLDNLGRHAFADMPANDVVHDAITGDLYVATDFGVSRFADDCSTWMIGGAGLPEVEVSSLIIIPADRKLYAATHGLSAWSLTLPRR